MATDARAELHGLLDQLPDDALGTVRSLVVRELQLRDAIIEVSEARGRSVEEARMSSGTVFRFNRDDRPASGPTAEDLAADPLMDVLMNAPEDDEPLSDEDLAAIAEGKAAVGRGEVVPWEAYDPNRRRRRARPRAQA
jgi:hypothetical protein